MAATNELPIRRFASAKAWENWLTKNATASNGIWVKIAKKASGIATVSHDEALNAALCFGWIDGQRNSFDDEFFLQKFTPRRRRSLWSKRNTEKVTRLIEEGRMQPSGFDQIEAAKQDGRWEAAYDSPKNMVVPDDFLAAVKKSKKAQAHFKTLSKTNKFAIGFRLATAKKPETRQRRFDKMLAMLERGEFR